jgi:hypothetical protein
MARLRRFEHHRYVGARDTMVVYDTDDAEQSAELAQRMEADRLLERNLLQAFGPDTLEEAANRGFRPYPNVSARRRAASRGSS